MDRRFFLRGAGGLTLALPFLGSLAGRAKGAAAAKATATLNNIVFMHMDYTWGLENIQPPADLAYEALEEGMRRAPLPADFSAWGASYKLANDKLKPLRDQIAFIRGLDYTGARQDHWNNCFLSGSGRQFGTTNGTAAELCTETVDQLLGRKIYQKRGITPAMNAIVVGNNDFSYQISVINQDGSTATPEGTFHRGNLANVPHSTVVGLYAALFHGLADTEMAQRLGNLRDESMLNSIYEEYRSLLKNPRLSAIDNQNLQQYLALIHDFEQRLATRKAMACKAPTGPAPTNALDDWYYQPDHAAISLMPILASALSCGATRVVTQCLFTHGVKIITDVTAANNASLPAANQSDYHHGIIHSMGFGPDTPDTVGSGDAPTAIPVALAAAAKVDAYNLGLVADFAALLKSFVDESTETTLLDQTAIVLGREHGTVGRHFDVHMLRDIHNLVIGGNAVFATGYLYDYKTSTPAAANYGGAGTRQFLGLPYNDFLYGVMIAMGLSPSDWESGGQPGFGTTKPTAPAANNAKYYVRDMRSPPPKLLKGT
jgi:hypothetical protein